MQPDEVWAVLRSVRAGMAKETVLQVAENRCPEFLMICVMHRDWDAHALEALALALSLNSTLEELKFWGGAVPIRPFTALLRAIRTHRSLKKLAFIQCNIDTARAEAMAHMLGHNSTLTHLRIDRNSSIRDEGATAIAAALQESGKRGSSALVCLSLEDCSIGEAGEAALTDVQQHSTILSHLSINSSPRTRAAALALQRDQGSRVLAEFFRRQMAENQNRTVDRPDVLAQVAADLDVLASYTAPAGLEPGKLTRVVALALVDNVTLTNLNLDAVCIDDDNVAAIAAALGANNSALVRLSMKGSSIGDAGARALAHMLSHNSTLKQLIIDGNSGVGDVGATAIATALGAHSQSSALVHLGMEGCSIGEVGAKALADMLSHNALLDRSSLVQSLSGLAKVFVELRIKTLCHEPKDVARVLQGTTGSTTTTTTSSGSMGSVSINCGRSVINSLSDLSRLVLELYTAASVFIRQPLTIDAARAVAHALVDNDTLTNLTLTLTRDHQASADEGAAAIAAALGERNRSSALVHLCMRGADVGEAGAVALVDMLRHNSTLDRGSLVAGLDGLARAAVELCMRTTCSVPPDLPPAGVARVVACALRGNETLTRLTVGSRISTENMVQILNALKGNTCLVELRVMHCNIGVAGAQELLAALASPSNRLTSICISDANLSTSEAFARHLATFHHSHPDLDASFTK